MDFFKKSYLINLISLSEYFNVCISLYNLMPAHQKFTKRYCAILRNFKCCKNHPNIFWREWNTVNLLNPIAVSFMLFMFGSIFCSQQKTRLTMKQNGNSLTATQNKLLDMHSREIKFKTLQINVNLALGFICRTNYPLEAHPPALTLISSTKQIN